MAQVKISALAYNANPPLNAELIIANNGVSQKTSLSDLPAPASKNYNWTLTNTPTYTATNFDGIFADTSINPITITLPSIVAIGDKIKISDPSNFWFTNNVTVNSSLGNTFDLLVSPLILNVSNATVELIATSTSNWRIM